MKTSVERFAIGLLLISSASFTIADPAASAESACEDQEKGQTCTFDDGKGKIDGVCEIDGENLICQATRKEHDKYPSSFLDPAKVE